MAGSAHAQQNLGDEEEGVDFSAFKNNEYKNLALLMTWFVDAG